MIEADKANERANLNENAARFIEQD